MTVNVYKSWTGRDFDTLELPEGSAIKDCVKGVDWNNAVILCNGNRVNENHVLKETDVVAIRETPSTSFLIGTAIVLAAFGVAELVSYATTGQGLFANLRDWLMPDMSSNSNKEQSQQETLPTLKGARNQNISGKPVPFVVGQTRITPYKVGTGYHSVSGTDGETQRYHQLYVIGYNDIRCGMFKFGETDFAYNGMSESYDANGGYKLKIGEGKKYGEITDFEQKTPFAKASPKLSISDEGEVPGFSTKITEEGIGKQIINANGSKLKFTRASDRYPRTIEVEIAFNGLMSYNDEGKEQQASAQISVGYSIDGGKTFEPFNSGFVGRTETVDVDDEDKASGIKGKLLKDTIVRKKNKTMRFVASHTFSYDEFRDIEEYGNGYAWIRVERADPDSTDSKTNNKAYLAYIRTWVYDKEKSETAKMYVPQAPIIERLRDKTTRCGVSINATENVSDELDEFNCMAVAECRTWNVASWSDWKSPTDNPAANALNVMQSAMLGDFAYPDAKIDLDEFGRLYEFCDANKFSVGTALTSRKKLSEVVDNILIQARAYRIVYGQKYSVFIDKPIYTPACVLNNSNILKDGASNSKEFKPFPDGFKIKFVNKNIGYDEDEVYVMFNDNISYDDPSAVIESLEMPFVTDPYQVAKNAWFEYGKRKLRPELWKRTVTTEANLVEIGSLVQLQDDTIRVGIGNGGWITKVYINDGMVTGFKISSKINISDIEKSYGARITHSTDNSIPDIIVRKLFLKEPTYSDDFELETPVLATDASAPAIGDLVSIGEYGKETISAICLGKKDNGNGKFELSLVPYSSALYSMDSGAKVEFDSKVSSVQKSKVDGMFETVGKNEMLEAINNAVSGIVLEAYDKTPPTVPAIVDAKSTDVGNVQITFSPSTDDGSGVLQYAVWRRTEGSQRWNRVATIVHDESAGSYFYEDKPSVKFKTYVYAVSAYDRMNNESEKSAEASVLADVTRKPAPPNGISAYAGEYRIEIQYSHAGGSDASEQAAEWEYEISKDGGDSWGSFIKGFSDRIMYDFDRGKDGYPETNELKDWKFRARVKSPYGLFSDWTEIYVNTSSYGTWLIPPVETSAEAGEHLVMLRWGLDGATPYGRVLYDVLLGGEPFKEGMSSTYYAYRFAENLSADEVSALKFSVRARNEAHDRTAAFTVDTSAYLGYGIDKPWIKAKARKEGIDVSWDRTNEFYGKREFVLLKDGEEILRSGSDTEFFLPFGEGEFPEKDDILAIALTVRIEGDADAAESDAAEIDVSDYLTWIPQVPKAYPSASGRNANLSWDAQDGVYGFTGCEVQIAKGYRVSDWKISPITDEAELEWYAPAPGLNPYESLENYKRGDAGGCLEAGGLSVSLTLPLFGQDGGGASDTPYAFRLRGKSSAGKVSEWTEAMFVTCRAVSAYDVVKAWDFDDKGEKVKVDGALGAAQIFVEELSAIAANLGYITDGALKGNAYNYWAVGDVRSDDGSMMWRGSFRVGGKEQYILVEPRLKDGTPTGEYDITFVVGNYSVSATGTQIKGGAFKVFDDDGNLMFEANADGNKAAVMHSEELPEGMSQNVISNENLTVYNYTILFDSFEYNNEIYAIELVVTFADDDIELIFLLVSPNGREPLVADTQALLQFILTGNIFYLLVQYTQTYLAGNKLLTPYFTFNLAEKTVELSAYAISIYTSVEAGDTISLGDFYNSLETTAVHASYDELIPIFYKGEVVASVATYYESKKNGSQVYNVIRIYAIDKNFNSRFSIEIVKWTDPNDRHRFAPFFLETDGNFLYVMSGGFLITLYRIDLHTFDAQLSCFYLMFDNSEFYNDVSDYITNMGFRDLAVESDNLVIRKTHRIQGFVTEEDIFDGFGIVVIPKKLLKWVYVDAEGNTAGDEQISPAFIFKCGNKSEDFIVQSATDGKFSYLTVQDDVTTLYARELNYGNIIGMPSYCEVIDDGVFDKMLTSFESIVVLGQVSYILHYGSCKNILFTDKGIEFYVVEKDYNKIANSEENSPVKLSFFVFGNESTKQISTEIHSLGVGFSEIVINKLSGNYKLFISDKNLFDGKRFYIEFDAYGNIVLDKEQIKDVVDNKLVVMTGANDTANGKKGLVPAPAAGEQDKFLRGDGSWMPALLPQAVFDLTVPVKSTYTQYPGMPDPNKLYNNNGINSTWEVIDYQGAFFRAEGGKAAEFIAENNPLDMQEESVQNIKGLISGVRVARGIDLYLEKNAFKTTSVNDMSNYENEDKNNKLDKLTEFNASLSNAAYGRRDEVAPANFTIRIWERKS